MNVAVVQLNSGARKARNIDKTVALVHRAIGRKARFIVLPEAFNVRVRPDASRGFLDIAERLPGPSTLPLMEIARKHKVHILAGSVAEAIKGSQKAFNTSVLINDKGAIVAKYRKIHLFEAAIGGKKLRESRWLKRGNKGVCVKIGPWKAGLSICYDLRFPALYRKYARAGANILCVPSSFTRLTGKAHWEILLRARAIENISYVLAPGQCGRDGQGVASYGHSMIVDPWGKVLARASGHREEVITARIDLKEITRRTKILPGQARRALVN